MHSLKIRCTQRMQCSGTLKYDVTNPSTIRHQPLYYDVTTPLL